MPSFANCSCSANPAHAATQRPGTEHLHRRPGPRAGAGGWRGPSRVGLRGTPETETEAAPCISQVGEARKYGSTKACTTGELVQIDHMTYVRDGQTIKEFRAICPITKFMTTRVDSRATVGNARRFLMDLLKALPFPLQCIQVDGDSKFMAQFENACEQLHIPLCVLPPRRPQFNGCVERVNRSAQIEFWNLYDGPLTVEQVARSLAS